jgi:mannose/fructose-specific phosphotransferase system component IIA
MSDEGDVRGIVLAHGSMAQGLTDAVTRIAGIDPGILIPLSNQGKSPQALEDEVMAIVNGESMILFVDLGSGSCAFTAKRCSKGDHRLPVVTGVNLPLLLDFVFSRHLPLHELIPRLVGKGREAIAASPDYRDYVDPPVSS